MNVNVPNGWSNGVHLTRQGNRFAHNVVLENTDPRDRKYYWIHEQVDYQKIPPDSDYAAIRDDHISITPLTVGRTDIPALRSRHRWIKSFHPHPVR